MSLTYSINDLAGLSGIKAPTLRIWEKRYGVLSPHRTDTNIRRYSDEDLRKVLNISTLLKAGWKISKVSELNTQELESEVWNRATGDLDSTLVFEIHVQALISASLSFDEDWFETVFTEASSRYGLPDVMEHIVGPFLVRIGLMWTVMRMHPGQEHFASNIIRRKILTAIDKLPKSNPKGVFLLFLPPWEEHEIGLLYAWFLLRRADYDVIYLGQRVPLEAVRQTVKAVDPDALLTFLVTENESTTLQSFVDTLEKEFSHITLFISAHADMVADLEFAGKPTVLSSAQDLINMVEL